MDTIDKRVLLSGIDPGSKSTAALSSSTILFESNFSILKTRFPRVAGQILDHRTGRGEVEVQETSEGAVIFLNGLCLDHPQKPIAAGSAWTTRTLSDEKIVKASSLILYGFGAGYHVSALLNSTKADLIVVEPSLEAFKKALFIRDLSDCLLRLKDLVVGEDFYPQDLPDSVELVVRPQAQAFAADHCQKIRSLTYEKRGFTSLHPKVGVLGPLQGGTLPIAGYCAQALINNRQLIRQLDVSGFNGSFHEIKKFLKNEQRRSVAEGHYVQMISNMIVESINEHPIDILLCMAQAPISGAALQELRKRGVITVLWFVEDYLRFTYWREMARYYDFVFTIQKDDCIRAIRSAGAGEVHYLPMAADPNIHAPVQLSPEERTRWGSPVSFVGAGYHNRQHVFASLVDFPLKIWGTEWPSCKPFTELVQEQGRRLDPAEYVKIFNATDININLHSSSERNDVDPFGDFVNPRTFELAASGVFQLVDERKLLPEVFEPGVEVATFKDSRDLKDKINYYLTRPEERAEISRRGRERVLRDHTYDQRIKQMLSIIYSTKFEHLQHREISNPWNVILRRTAHEDELNKLCKSAFDRGEDAKLEGIIAGIMNGKGKLSETEMKLLFLHHVSTQIIHMKREEKAV